MYEALIGELHFVASGVRSKHRRELLEKAAGAIKDLIAALTASNEVIAKSKPRWIPITERLPEDDSRILVCSELRDGQYWQSVCRFANNLHEVDEYDFPEERRPGFYYYDDEYGWVEMTGVAHWMPLPEPPKEET